MVVGNYKFIIKNIFEMKDVVYIELLILLMKFFFFRNNIFIFGLNYVF